MNLFVIYRVFFMKNYFKLSVALGLLFFSLPALAMEEQTDNPQVTKVLTQIIKSIVPQDFPDELTSQVTTNLLSGEDEDFPDEIASQVTTNLLRDEDGDKDYANAFYDYDCDPSSTHLKSVKSACLTFRLTCCKWRNLIDPLFKLIPISRAVSPGKDVLYPSLLSVVKFDLNPLTPEAVQEQCRLLSDPVFKNLVFFKISQYPERRKPRRLLTELDMNALASLLRSHADHIKYLQLDTLRLGADSVKIFAPVLPQLKNLEYFRVSMGYIDQEVCTPLIHEFSSLTSLKNMFLEGADGERECIAMTSVLPKLTKLEKFFIKGRHNFSVSSERLFYNFPRSGYEFPYEPTFVSVETQQNLIEVLQKHPNNKKLAWQVKS